MDTVKRDRSANFSLHERDILVSLVQKYQTVLENKQSDASTWKMKEAAWENIQNHFNVRSGGIFRSMKTLKVKYEGLKRTVRKKSAAIRSELHRTGGGKNTAPSLDIAEEQIKAMITLSTESMDSIYDSDILPQSQENQGNVPKITLDDELTQAKLELVQLQKKFLEDEIKEKKKVWEFEEIERKKEAKFKEKVRRWKEEEYKLKLKNNFK